MRANSWLCRFPTVSGHLDEGVWRDPSFGTTPREHVLEGIEDARPSALDKVTVLLALKPALVDRDQGPAVSFLEGHHNRRMEFTVVLGEKHRGVENDPARTLDLGEDIRLSVELPLSAKGDRPGAVHPEIKVGFDHPSGLVRVVVERLLRLRVHECVEYLLGGSVDQAFDPEFVRHVAPSLWDFTTA